MNSIAGVSQQSQTSSHGMQAKVSEQAQVQNKSVDMVKKMQQDSVDTSKFLASEKFNTKEQMENLVEKLNKAISPISTNIKFGVDSQDIFYVSVIDTETSKMIRRFPAEQASDFLPKMQEVTGILFDTVG